MDVDRQRRIVVTAYLTYIVAFYMVLFWKIEPFCSYVSTFGLIGHFLTFPLYWFGLNIHRGERRWPWIWFTATGVFYFLGDFLWAYYAEWLGTGIESPSPCDVFYLLNSYTCCCAFICYMRQIGDMRSDAALIDIILSVAALGGLLYRFIILPLVLDPSVGLFTMFFHANMSVIDLALFTGILIVIFGTAHSRFYTKRTLLLGLGFFLCCFVEQLSLAIEVYDLSFGYLFEPLWTVPFWFFALTATYPDEDGVDEQEKAAFHHRWDAPLHYMRVFLPYLLAASILFLLGPKEALQSTFFSTVLYLTAARAILSTFQCLRGQSAQTQI